MDVIVFAPVPFGRESENSGALSPKSVPDLYLLFSSVRRRKRRSTCSPWTTWRSATWRRASCPASTYSVFSTRSRGQPLEILKFLFSALISLKLAAANKTFDSMLQMEVTSSRPVRRCGGRNMFRIMCCVRYALTHVWPGRIGRVYKSVDSWSLTFKF